MNVLKLLTSASLVCALSLNAYGDKGNFSGFYVGAQGGYGGTKIDGQSLLNRDLPPHGVDRTTHAGHLGGDKMIGGIHAGYGRQFPNNFYLGIEAYGNLAKDVSQTALTTASADHNPAHPTRFNANTFLKAERSHTLGMTLRPGIVMDKTLVYAKIGIESFDAIFSASDSSTFSSPGMPNHTRAQKGKSRKRIYGFVPGIGVYFKVTDHVLLGFEASHGFYQSHSFNLNKKGSRATFKSQTNDVLARVSYQW